MNASRLRGIISDLLEKEEEYNIQNLLAGVVGQLANMSNQPNQPGFQTAFASTLDQLTQAYNDMRESFEPAQIKQMEEIGAGEYFLDDLPGEIKQRLAENPATPAVVQQYISVFQSERGKYINIITELQNTFDRLGIKANALKPGEAEIGFTIPRDLFENELDGLIGELREIRFIMRTFSEAVTGSIEPIVIKQISTSDPLFFFGVASTTIVAVGKTVHWVLDTWKKVEGIREVRERTRKLQIESEKVILDAFDKSIKDTINTAVEAKVKELTTSKISQSGRGYELETQMGYALRSLFARIERGMTVEIRFIPPPPPEGEFTDEAVDTAAPFVELAKISSQLVFPSPTAAPILALPRSHAAKDPDASKVPNASSAKDKS